ncbi:MAG TPA: serine/threonine-protein kinase [Myxococcales bacterium]|nr:serine/threonine-protein kinase [Myxococcales bacterium]
MDGPDPLIGERLGDYQVVERIGEGAMGIVYRGFQPLIRKRVAIKVLKPEVAEDPGQARRLLAEAQSVNAIGHRGIIDIFGFGEVPDGRHYLVMEYLEGQSLDRLIADRGAMFPLEAIPLLIEICSALAAAHARGIVHRDLKPSNVFVVAQPDGAQFIKLLDFGLAKRGEGPRSLTPQTGSMRIVGTPEYIAPEQARSEPVSPRTDLYALGVMAYEMLTGRLPFRAESPIEMVMQHLETRPPKPSSLVVELPPRLDDLVVRMMAKEPSKRPNTADEVRTELISIERDLLWAARRAAARGGPSSRALGGSDTTVPTDEMTARRRQTLRTVVVAAGALMGLALLAAAILGKLAPPEPPQVHLDAGTRRVQPGP